jgi:flagellar hook-length control protein FliK
MNLSGLIGILQTAHTQQTADKPVETARHDQPRESFEQLVSKAVEDSPRNNERKSESPSPSRQKDETENSRTADEAAVTDRMKQKEPVKETTAGQEQIAEQTEILKDQPKDKNSKKISAGRKDQPEDIKEDKKSDKDTVKTDIAELLTHLDALKHTLQKSEPSRADLAKMREKITNLSQKISREIAQGEEHSAPDQSRIDLLKKQNAFLKKIDALLADTASPKAMRLSKLEDISKSMIHDLRELVKLAEKKNIRGGEARIEQPAVKNMNEQNQKEPRAATASTENVQNIQSHAARESGDSYSQTSLFKQFSFSQDSTGIIRQTTAPHGFLPFADKLDELVNQAKITSRDGKNGQISMKMYPESLGSVNVNLGIENGVLTAKFLVENSEAKDALTANIAFLKETLSNEGITVGSFQVDVRGEGRFLTEQHEENAPVHYMPHEAKEAELEYNLRQSSSHNGLIDLVV